MSAYKQFLASDIVLTPFEVNKGFEYKGQDALTGSDVGIERHLGVNSPTKFYSSSFMSSSGVNKIEFDQLVYNSIKHLYYSNHLSSSYADEPEETIYVIGQTLPETRNIGGASSRGRYYNYLQSSITFERIFPTGSDDEIGVISIPSGLFGEKIQRGSFLWEAESGSVRDDGEGNLVNFVSGTLVGNIVYAHGLAVFKEFQGSSSLLTNLMESPNVTCSFSSSITIHESQYKCNIRENEFNVSLNPTSITRSINGTDGTVLDFTTSSFFQPYITTIGLYNDDKELMGVGKLSLPIPSNHINDMTIIISIDK